MICPNCGARVTNSSYCDNCGASLSARSSRRSTQDAGGRRARSSYPAGSGTGQRSAGQRSSYQPARASQGASQYRRSQYQQSQYQRSPYQPSGYQPYGVSQPSGAGTAVKVIAAVVVIAAIAAAIFFFVIRPGQAAQTDTSSSAEGVVPVQAADTFDARNYDSFYNPTLYAVTELTGTELGDALERVRFEWATAGDTWYASDGSMVYAEGAGGSYTNGDFGILAAGAAGIPVKFVVVAAGYSSPDDAVNGLAKDVAVVDQDSDSKHAYAIVANSADRQYLVVAHQSASNEQTLEIYNEEAIANGLLEDVTADDATVEDAWQTVTA